MLLAQDVGFCTPFVSNDGSTSTHTPEASGNWTLVTEKSFSSSDSKLTAVFEHEVRLMEGMYSIIAHGRFYSNDDVTAVNTPHALF